jgi:multidrug efflux pump subunit AcrA (membrane-fusion protein)
MKTALRQHRPAWRASRLRRLLIISAPAAVVVGALVPWPITITGPFVAAPLLSMPHAAPDSGIVQLARVREGTRVPAGAPLIEIRNLRLERELVVSRRISDSLAARAAQARSRGHSAEVALIEAEQSVEAARLAGLSQRAEALRIRALGSGTVVTRRPEELAGRWVSSGEVVLELGHSDSVEIRIALTGAGGTLVSAGAPVSLLQDATLHRAVRSKLSTVSAAANGPGTIEARLRLPAGRTWRPGMTGRASVTLRQSNVWGALWWRIRRGIRSDILL